MPDFITIDEIKGFTNSGDVPLNEIVAQDFRGVKATLDSILEGLPPLPGTVTYSAPGTFTFTVPKKIVKVSVRLAGGGGPGANGSNTTENGDGYGHYFYSSCNAPSGAGGGASEQKQGEFIVTPGQTIAVTVGRGGDVGVNGGTSSFGGFLSGTGGEKATGAVGGKIGGGTGNIICKPLVPGAGGRSTGANGGSGGLGGEGYTGSGNAPVQNPTPYKYQGKPGNPGSNGYVTISW